MAYMGSSKSLCGGTENLVFFCIFATLISKQRYQYLLALNDWILHWRIQDQIFPNIMSTPQVVVSYGKSWICPWSAMNNLRHKCSKIILVLKTMALFKHLSWFKECLFNSSPTGYLRNLFDIIQNMTSMSTKKRQLFSYQFETNKTSDPDRRWTSFFVRAECWTS